VQLMYPRADDPRWPADRSGLRAAGRPTSVRALRSLDPGDFRTESGLCDRERIEHAQFWTGDLQRGTDARGVVVGAADHRDGHEHQPYEVRRWPALAGHDFRPYPATGRLPGGRTAASPLF